MNLSELKEKTKWLFGKNKKLTAQAFEAYTDAIGNLDVIQDTGWIDVPVSYYTTDGTRARARRIGSTVTLDISNEKSGALVVKGSGLWTQKDQLGQDYYATIIVPAQGIPKGFRSLKTIVGSVYMDGPEAVGTWQLLSSPDDRLILKIKNKRTGDAVEMSLSRVEYFTDDPFPKIENGKIVN